MTKSPQPANLRSLFSFNEEQQGRGEEEPESYFYYITPTGGMWASLWKHEEER
jgi:hypothetical protein